MTMMLDLTKGIPNTRDASMTWIKFMGIDPNDPTTFGNLRDYGIALQDEPWVYSSIMKTATACQSVPLRVYQRQGQDLIPVEQMESGPLLGPAQRYQHLLDWVNPIDMTGDDLKAATAASWFLYGGYYIKKVRGLYGGEPQELYWLAPPDVQPNSVDGRTVTTYSYRPQRGAMQDIRPPDMIVHRRFNPNDPLTFLSPLSSVRNEIQVQINASIHTSALLKNHSIPPMAITAAKGAELTTQDVSLLTKIFRAIKGPTGAGKTPIIPVEIEVKDLSVHSLDAQYIQAREIARKAICAVIGMPPVVAGDDDKTNVYGNWRDARKAWWQDTLITYLDGQATCYNNWLTPDFDPTGQLVVGYDYGQIEALQEPWATQVQGLMMLQDRGDVVGNEVRARLRLGKRTEWGDQPMPLAKVALKGDAFPMTALGTGMFGVEPVPTAPQVFEPSGLSEPGLPDTGASARAAQKLAAYGRDLYTHPAVRAYLADRSAPLDAQWLFGEPLAPALRAVIETGLARRYSAEQLVRGVPGEKFAGFQGVER
jgi:HK97 family phage portal protein